MPALPRMSCPDEAQRPGLEAGGLFGPGEVRMLPSGSVSVAGQTLDVSEGMVIEAGQTVHMIKIESNRLVVRAVEGKSPSSKAENPLERPISSIAAAPSVNRWSERQAPSSTELIPLSGFSGKRKNSVLLRIAGT